MRYTLWCDKEKIGDTRFELRPGPQKLAGALHPTAVGLAMLPTLGPAKARLELRDPSGKTLRWDSIIISDMAEIVERETARRHDAHRFGGLPGAPIRFMIAATVPLATE